MKVLPLGSLQLLNASLAAERPGRTRAGLARTVRRRAARVAGARRSGPSEEIEYSDWREDEWVIHDDAVPEEFKFEPTQWCAPAPPVALSSWQCPARPAPPGTAVAPSRVHRLFAAPRLLFPQRPARLLTRVRRRVA